MLNFKHLPSGATVLKGPAPIPSEEKILEFRLHFRSYVRLISSMGGRTQTIHIVDDEGRKATL
jgi:hypothetical protein